MFYAASWIAKTKAAFSLGTVGVFALDIYLVQRYLLEGLYPRILPVEQIHFDFVWRRMLCRDITNDRRLGLVANCLLNRLSPDR